MFVYLISKHFLISANCLMATISLISNSLLYQDRLYDLSCDTKTNTTLLQRCLINSAWNYPHCAAIKTSFFASIWLSLTPGSLDPFFVRLCLTLYLMSSMPLFMSIGACRGSSVCLQFLFRFLDEPPPIRFRRLWFRFPVFFSVCGLRAGCPRTTFSYGI